jgi:uncharacterized membrane protein YccC
MSARSWRPQRGIGLSWSVPAALRAVRAVLVIPTVFALCLKVIGDPQLTLFAVFGCFGTLVLTAFGGNRRDKAIAHLGLAVAGSVTLTLGTLLSSTAWLAALGAIPVAFAVFAAGSVGPNAASGVSACLLAFVLPVASTGYVNTLPSRLAGWWLASAASTLAVLLLASSPPGDRLRAQTAAMASTLAGYLDSARHGAITGTDQQNVSVARSDLQNAFVAAPYRPIGLASADQGLANLIHLLEWCAELMTEAIDGDVDLSAAAEADRELLALYADGLRRVAAVLSGKHVSMNAEEIWQARLGSTARLQRLSRDPATGMRTAADAFLAQALGVAVAAAMSEAMVAARLSTPAALAAERRRWLVGLPGGGTDDQPSWAGNPERVAGIVAADASLRSVFVVNSLRGAIAIAAAVAVAKISGVEHAFWVVLGTLAVLRTSAAATGATALRALLGTVVGFVVGAALLVAIGTNPATLWIILPFAVLVTAYTPGTAPFAVGQAAFTIFLVVLFNLLIPAGWIVGLLRVEDIAIGCGVGLIVGFLFWPRGVASVVGDNLADAFRAGASYLGDAVDWALGIRPDRPVRAVTAIAAGARLDDAVRGYLTEQGSKRLTKTDLWALTGATLQLQLTAHSIASLPDGTEPHDDDHGLHAALGRQVAGLTDFYDGLAARVGRPVRAVPETAAVALPGSAIAADASALCGAPGAYREDALWVGLHLDRLGRHAAEATGPAQRLAAIRRRPWWR